MYNHSPYYSYSLLRTYYNALYLLLGLFTVSKISIEHILTVNHNIISKIIYNCLILLENIQFI